MSTIVTASSTTQYPPVETGLRDELSIRTKGLNLWYGDFQALMDVSINIKKGIITGLIGPSGCGKTTLLRCFNRINERYGNVNTIGPRGVYDESKRFQEAITNAYHTFYGLDIRIARIFNTYGPRMRLSDGRALPTFMSQALKNKPITIFGDGSQSRSFCYVDDLIIGIYLLLKSGYTKPINLGNPDEITILNFAKEILALTGGNSRINYKTLPLNDPLKRKPDISKAKKILQWEPIVSREEGLKKTLKYFNSKIKQ